MLRFLLCLPFLKCGSGTGDQELVIRKFIRKSVKKGTTLEETDEKIRKKFGENEIEYKELDYWYHQFYNGKKGMKDKRSPSNKASLELLNLPNEMIHSIVSHLPVPDKLNLQLVSNCLGSFAALSLEDLIININENSMTFFNPRDPNRSEEIAVPINSGYTQLKILFSRMELKLDSLTIKVDDASIANGSALRNIQKLFNSINHQLHIKHFFSFGFLKDQLSLLPHFNPTVLYGMSIIEHNEPPEPFLETIQELVKLEQWRQLKILHISFQYRNPLVFYPVEHFMQFEVVGLGDLVMSIDGSPGIFEWIRELIMTSPNIEKIDAGFHLPFREIIESLDSDIEIAWQNGHDGLAYWRTPRGRFLIGQINAARRHHLMIVRESGNQFFGFRPMRVTVN